MAAGEKLLAAALEPEVGADAEEEFMRADGLKVVLVEG
jgi:hypothetical protein